MKKILLVSVLFAPTVFADTAETIAQMQVDMITNLTLVGTAMIAVAAVAVGFKWIKASIFG
jgi:hypothetical protein